jgi:multiple sugar transport system permease protein
MVNATPHKPRKANPKWHVLPNALCVVLLVAVALAMVLPVGVMLVLSLTGPGQQGWGLQAYATLSQQLPLASIMAVSVGVALATTACHLAIAAITAFGLSRFNVTGKAWLKWLLLITMMVPVQVNLVPLFLLMRELHTLNTLWALIVPGCFGAFGFLFLTDWMDTLPRTLDEAAYLDGCTPTQVWWHVVLPLCRPALVTIGLLLFITTWNSFIWPLLVVQDNELMTLPVAIASLKGSYREAIDWPVIMAGCSVSTVPLLVVFALGNKALLGGMLAGSIKE